MTYENNVKSIQSDSEEHHCFIDNIEKNELG